MADRDPAKTSVPEGSNDISENRKHGPPETDESELLSSQPAVKRRKEDDGDAPDAEGTVKTPDIASETNDEVVEGYVQKLTSSGSVSSDLSSSTGTPAPDVTSPVGYTPKVPPAPPSTPASNPDSNSWEYGPETPLPIRKEVQNAAALERQMLAEGAATPAPKQPPKDPTPQNPPEDFSDWAVGDRYDLKRILGRGSYGQVAQAVDLFAGRPDAFVAIKRIQSPFDEEVDAIRLYREMYILRKMRGHSCIIQLLDVVQPPTDDLDDFHDLYLVFECKCSVDELILCCLPFPLTDPLSDVDTDLYKLIMSPQFLTTEHIQTFLYQMLAGLKYMHTFSVIHRDLKPANILLNEDCSLKVSQQQVPSLRCERTISSLYLKICDFGLSRIVDPSAMSTRDEDKPRIKTPVKLPGSPPRVPLTRQLTKHVVTRWYRAPELILIQPYSSAVDIWSLGCILAELLSMQEGNVPGYEDRKPLFPGGSCYPLSGEGDKAKPDDRLDQLAAIFTVIGTPPPSEIEKCGKAVDYIKSLGKIEPRSLAEIFPDGDPLAIDLLGKMLAFNPKDRSTASEALEHPFFKGIRRPEMEAAAEESLKTPAFLDSNSIDPKVIKQRVYEEVLHYRGKGG